MRRSLHDGLPPTLDELVLKCLDHVQSHRRGVIHRDIKPSNILLTVEDRVKIVDFGLAQSARASTKQPVGGTVKYIAPEQARGHKTDARTDIYSLFFLLVRSEKFG